VEVDDYAASLKPEKWSSGNGAWVRILEQAAAIALSKDAGPRVLLGGPRSTRSFIDRDNFCSAGIELLTGHSTSSDSIPYTTTEDLRKHLVNAFDSKRLVTASGFNVIPVFGGITMNAPKEAAQKRHNIQANHVYTVIDYNDKERKICLRNPWGHTEPEDSKGRPLDGVNDGLFWMRLGDFEDCFTIVSFEKAK
jgi:hypothetical protein